MTRRGWHALVAAGIMLACTEDPTAPGRCPDYCPPGEITFVDTLLETVVVRDSAYRGYLQPQASAVLIASTVPGVVDSRPIIDFQPAGTTIRLGPDTTSYPILGTDSSIFGLTILRRDTSAGNLRVQLFRLPVGLDSNTTYADLAGPFADSLVESVNVDSLLDVPADSMTGDRAVAFADTVRLLLRLDSTQVRFVAADSGRLAYGIRVLADTATTAVFGANESSDAALIDWYFRVDSAGTTAHSLRRVSPQFDSYVFDPPVAPMDSSLVIGGMPSARSLVRIELPPYISDSTQVVRAILALVPAAPALGAPTDSFTLIAHAVLTDIGAKSPLISQATAGDSSFFGTATVPIGSTDTVFVEVTRILRRWAADTSDVAAMILRSGSEGLVLTEARFHSSRHATLRPSLRVTYVPRFQFGVP